MKNKIIILLLLALFACEKDEIEQINCENFVIGCSSLNNDLVRNEIKKLTVDLEPLATSEDSHGHMYNLQTLVKRLNDNCADYIASVSCYACIKTYPAQSEILIEFVDPLIPSVIIEIHTPENDILRYAGIHVE